MNNSPSPSAKIYESENCDRTFILGKSGIIAASLLGSSIGETDSPPKEKRCNLRSSDDND